ncbi:hypothetical protein JL475_32750 [Streptomyces sp. M2CJ-2]|uniref:hypothetical protein n=1 Tax=Streptomyces sp. M2CJ-2 TaxID=2803948 RepID=UPI0019275F38|nr:hypothetical protein [Streptomyces sp. M2CJ-2]MBL3670657.1 hypothetical protein [Streptomyces sp. M2CJ-2]
MTTPKDTMEAAPLLGLPLPDPAPALGCTDCQRWARQRETARTKGDGTWVSDCNVRIRRCTH